MLALAIGFLFALFLPSGHVLACPPNDISPVDLQKLQTQAAQVDKIAQFSLGIMCGKELGMQQNDVKAIMWLTLVAASADYIQEMTANIRDEIALCMTPTQMAEAQ